MRPDIFTSEALTDMRSQFIHVSQDYRQEDRLFCDNAGGSLRLKAAEDTFYTVDAIPDCSEHSNRVAVDLLEIENKGRRDIKEVLFNARSGAIYPSYSASQTMMETMRVIGKEARGTNYVTTVLEHPSAFDSAVVYAREHQKELRVAQVNRRTGGVDAEEVLSLVDKNTAILSCMAASNISGYVYDIETIFREARRINPEIFIVCDAVQHAPHGVLDPEAHGIDMMNFAPYKFFSIRGFAVAYLSERVASLAHHRLLAVSPTCWDLGSPSPAHYAAFSKVIDYVCRLGTCDLSPTVNRRQSFEAGMNRIAAHERMLLETLLEGTGSTLGLRHLPRLKVQMDCHNLQSRDLILSIEFQNLSCTQAVHEFDKRGIVVFDRATSSLYSKRMVQAFDEHSEGVVRISPLHINTVDEMLHFLAVAEELTRL